MSDVSKFDLPWPQENVEIFKTGGNYYEFAHIGWDKSLSMQFHGYIEGYKNAADILIEHAISTKNIKTLDTFIFPICFLYRQTIELQMKDIYLNYSGDTKKEKKDVLKKKGHSLIGIWNKLKPVITEDASDSEIEELKIVEEYIKQFHEFDLKSDMFRYPINNDLELFFKHENRLNLPNLKDRMNELYNFFSGVDAKLSAIQDYKNEMMAEYYSYLDYNY